MKHKRLILKYPILIIVAYMGLVFDQAMGERFFILLGLFVAVFVLNALRDYKGWPLETYLVDALLLAVIEYNSRFILNYFFHSFYVFIILQMMLIDKTFKWKVALGVTLLSMGTFLYLLVESYSLGALAEVLFFTFINILLISIGALNERYRQEKERTEALYLELRMAWKQVEELTTVKERTRIAREVHDTLGHEMTAHIMHLEMLDHFLKEDPAKAEEMMSAIKDTARGSLRKIREVITTLRTMEEREWTKEVSSLIAAFQEKTGMEVKLKGLSTLKRIPVSCQHTLYRLIQEAMTNTAKHGSASEMEIELQDKDEAVYFSIRDNGVVSGGIVEGYGITGMRERVTQCKGQIQFSTHQGFHIWGRLPKGEQDEDSTRR